MNWYTVKLVFLVSTGKGVHKPQFDEQLRMVSSNNPEEAYRKARLLGQQYEQSFVNDKGVPIKWSFVEVADLVKIEELKDGVELYTYTHETDDHQAYISHVVQKGSFIRSMSVLQTIQL